MRKILSIIALSLLFVSGASAQEVCTTTDQSVTENVCHTETVQDTNRVCHNEFAIWDVFHWFPREVCENVVSNRELEICTPVTTCETIPDTIGGGAVRIFYIPEIKDYSFKKISANIYEFNFVGKNMDLIRQRPKIKWGKDIDDVSFASWEEYAEIKNIYIPDGQRSITFWVRNSDSTGKTLTVNLSSNEYKGD